MLSIAVGIFAVAVMMGGRAVLIRALDTGFPATQPPSVSYFTTAFDEHLVREVERDPEVAAAQGRRAIQMSFRRNGGPWTNITLYAFKDYSDISVARLTLLDGAKAPARGEILLEKGSASFFDIPAGDQLEFETSDKTHPVLTITGIAHDLNATVPMMTGRAVGYINWDDLPAFDEQQQFNQLDVVDERRQLAHVGQHVIVPDARGGADAEGEGELHERLIGRCSASSSRRKSASGSAGTRISSCPRQRKCPLPRPQTHRPCRRAP